MLQHFLFLQATDIERTMETQSLLDLLFSGGAIGVAIVLVLLVLSIVALYIFIERYMTIKKAGH
ncbi:MAG: MotA/TolQ/ExbB proton channel family protein, partial [Saprospiraceae bacterium]